MAGFELKSLQSLVRKASDKIDAAAGVSDITTRTDDLLAAREDTDAAFGKAAHQQIFKMAGAGLAMAAGGFATYLGYAAATSIFALIAGSTGFAIPLMIAGAAVFAAGTAGLGIAGTNYKRVKDAWKSLTGKVDKAVKHLVAAHPQETGKSQKLSAFLKQDFNPAASAAPAQDNLAPAATATPATRPGANAP